MPDIWLAALLGASLFTSLSGIGLIVFLGSRPAKRIDD